MKFLFPLTACLLLLFPPAPAFGQETGPRGFRNLLLGMSLEAVKEELQRDPWFFFRGDPDVSLLLAPNESLIDCRGSGYIRRAAFQFDQGRLFIITLMIDSRRSDYYSLFLTLQERFGEFESLSPDKVVWDDGQTRLTLERPLTVKYIDRAVFDRKLAEARAGADLLEQSHRDFLNQF
ncbi:MAG: hypothetical protein LBQ61_07485 [Spirochaetales bacterium]|jgi:hypothetical protein|nr:hypothetical protein [Spirochaetales bacterium]